MAPMTNRATTPRQAAPARHGQGAPTGRPSRALQLLDAELDILDRAEAMLREGESLVLTDPRAAYELVHRAALRAAGVVVSRANRDRRRRLPLNAWTALARVGGEHRAWSEEMMELVAERDRLSRREDATPDPVLLARHRDLTTRRIRMVREEVLEASLPEDLSSLGS